MWDQGGQPWPQWPLSQQQWMQSFQHQHDPGQVDWAALAQAWIAQKESTGPPQHNVQPNGQDMPSVEPVGQSNHGTFQGEPPFSRAWQPEWGIHGQPPQPPPPPPPDQAWIPPVSAPIDVVNPREDSNSQDSNSHGYGAQPESFTVAPMAMNQFDYQHGAASSFTPTPSGFPSQYWQGPSQNRREARPPGFRDRPRSPIQLPVKAEVPAPLDAVKRRTLPAWIREGLEKMDREKQRKLERERMEKERAEMAKDTSKAHNADEAGDGPRMPRRSKFDSDDEGNEDVEKEEKPPVKREFAVRSPSPPAEDSEPELTEDLKEEVLMGITKTLLTEILLGVTNEEILSVARETHRKATRGGLGDYGSDESEDDDVVQGSESSDTDDEELHHRIQEKQDAFRRKEREIQQLQDKQAQEALLARGEFCLGSFHNLKVLSKIFNGKFFGFKVPLLFICCKSRSRERRDSSQSRGSKHKQRASSKDRDKRRERSRSQDKKKRDRDAEKKKEKPKAREKEKGSSAGAEENGKSKKKKESDSRTDSQRDKLSRQDSKSSKKGSSKASKRHSDSDSSRSPTPEVSKEKKSKKSKRSRSRSTEKSHKSGKKASRKHKSKSRSRSASPPRRSRR
uniref:PNN-interacting serine/arginine-rich protein n=1 Tax=Oryzias sinensis TaxID=183150 RepID=A0A8C7WZQ9_9TELE